MSSALKRACRGSSWLRRFVLASAATAVCAGPAWAQGSSVAGVVKDETGGRLPGATITITNNATGATKVLVTESDGSYRAVALSPAAYLITADLEGFAQVSREVVLIVGTEIIVDFTMSVGAVEENVTVIGEIPLVAVSKSQPTSSVVADQIQTLPVLSRSFLELAQLLPGAAPEGGSFMTTKFGGVADQRSGFTTMVDGAVIDDAIWGAALVNVSQEAVQEFTVNRHRFDAQYGSALNAVVNVASKSGTNQFSGECKVVCVTGHDLKERREETSWPTTTTWTECSTNW